MPNNTFAEVSFHAYVHDKLIYRSEKKCLDVRYIQLLADLFADVGHPASS